MTMSAKSQAFKAEVIAALKEELETSRKLSAGERSNEVKNGIKTTTRGDIFIYEFDEMTGYPPEEGTQISFSVGEKNTKGRYLGEVDNRFIFELEGDLGPTIQTGNAVSDPLFLLEKQIALLETNLPFENKVSLSTLGLEEYKSVKELKPNLAFMEGLNRLQKSALETVATNSVTYIWGPPGTGKTTTMGSVVAALANLGQKVLLVSNTNLALDTALERCLDRYSTVSELHGGEMLRIGTSVKPELSLKYEKQIDIDIVLDLQIKPLRKQLETLTKSLSTLRNDVSDLQDFELEVSEHTRKAKGSTDRKRSIENSKVELLQNKGELTSLIGRIDFLESELTSAENKGAIARTFAKMRNPGQIRLDILSEKAKRDQLEKRILRLEAELPKLEKELANIDKETKSSENWLKKNAKDLDFKQSFTKMKNEIAQIETQIKTIQDEISNKRKSILDDAKVIACTAYKPLLDKEILAMKFDCVVVDEASMLQLPLFYCAASLSQERIVVAGDFRQLPPIVRMENSSYGKETKEKERTEQLSNLLKENAFTKSGIINKSSSGANVKQLVALRDQYRMRSEISDLISDTFYPEQTLRTVDEKFDKPTPWGNESFILFDTTSLEPESATVNGKSRRNFVHALTIKAIYRHLVDDGWDLKSTANKSFGIISPYAKQSSLIENLISEDSATHVKGGISTVHRFQGNERDLMIIDLTKVSSPSEPSLGNFIGNPDPLATENAMWNVAISRARQHVFVIADLPTLERNKTSLIAQLIFKMNQNAKVIEAKTLIEEELLASSQIKPKSESGSMAWFSGTGFYKTFEKDLKGTKNRLFLSSPFTTKQGTDRWMQIFRDLRAKDVEIVCLTKPVSEKDSATNSQEIHASLGDVCKELRVVPKMHEKIAVIDQRITWLGSLNILSHKNSTEIMVRIDSPDFASSILKEYERHPSSQRAGKAKTSSDRKFKIGDKCDRPGCGGTFALIPAGVSRSSGRPYAAFLSCNNWRANGCKNSAEYVAD